ncbi:MerR family transcriptional regulator [Spongisporangium articulatum]|uniref:MerR family transcriptional regulator n=1 Tax=Spongisporangium articulatum TaxID=3362603 RepID=A0ABW8AQ99_9ACTN
MAEPPEAEAGRGLYGISVAAELVGLDPQSLRLYERRGLLQPARSDGGTRRYSSDDVRRLRRIKELMADGVNLAGVTHVLALESTNADLTEANADLTEANADLTEANADLTEANADLTAENDRLRRRPSP